MTMGWIFDISLGENSINQSRTKPLRLYSTIDSDSPYSDSQKNCRFDSIPSVI